MRSSRWDIGSTFCRGCNANLEVHRERVGRAFYGVCIVDKCALKGKEQPLHTFPPRKAVNRSPRIAA